MAAGERVTIQEIVRESGISSGSLYHRFGSREALLAEAWLDALLAFQARFLAALEEGGEEAGLQAALATPRFCREEPDRARILVQCRQSEFLCSDSPRPIKDKIETANANAFARISDFASGFGVDFETAKVAMVGFPLGAVKLYIPARPVPMIVDDWISEAFRAVWKYPRQAGD